MPIATRAVVSTPHVSRELIVVPLTSRSQNLRPGEFALTGWREAGLRIPTALKRGIYTVAETRIPKRVGTLDASDARRLRRSLFAWLGIRSRTMR